MTDSGNDDETLRTIIASNSVEGYFISLVAFAILDIRDIPGGGAYANRLETFLLEHEISQRDLPAQERQKLNRMRQMLRMILGALDERR